MKFKDLYFLAKSMYDIVGVDIPIESYIYLNESKHENLQQEVYKTQNGNLNNYHSETEFDVVFTSIKFTIKHKI